jgi:uroporphyrinogen decarboxylase
MKASTSVLALLLSTLTPCQSFAPIHTNAVPSRTVQSKAAITEPISATSSEEDLELTRQIIMAHLAKQSGSIYGDSLLPSHISNPEDYPENDLMIRTALGRSTTERTPVWLFRQAGRHLPEYNDYKKTTGRNFLEMLSYPQDVAECTLQPVRRYNVDAAILFSDILVIAEALNVKVTMPGGVGIQVPCPLVGPADMMERLPKRDELNREFVEERLGHVMESVRLIRRKMKEEMIEVPLIGFSAAPWTLLFYMVGGSSKKNNEIGVHWLKEYPEASRDLLDRLTTVIIEYMAQQVENGAHMLQLFEAMGMMIDEANFREFAMPCLEKIAKELKAKYPDVPLMVFSRGASFANEELSKLGYDVITIDGSVDRSKARDIVGDRTGLQGNYDPRELIPDGGDGKSVKTVETVRETATELLKALGPQRLIANLGEGLGGKESPELVNAFVGAIHEESERIINEEMN